MAGSEVADPIGDLAASINRHGLTFPAILLLELLDPLGFVGSQLLLVLDPLLSGFVEQPAQRYGWILEDRRNLTRLLEALQHQQPDSTR